MKGALEATSGKLGQAASSSNHSLSWWCIRTSFPTKSTQITSTAQCVLCSVYFSAQPNKLRPILNNWVLVSQWTNTCPSLFECAENIFFSHFCDFQTLDPWFPLKYTLSPYCIGYRVIKDTGASYWTKYTLCTVICTEWEETVWFEVASCPKSTYNLIVPPIPYCNFCGCCNLQFWFFGRYVPWCKRWSLKPAKHSLILSLPASTLSPPVPIVIVVGQAGR